MKGPLYRIQSDVRRHWRCPRCERVVKCAGDVTALSCACSDQPVWMVLQETQRRHREFRMMATPEVLAETILAMDPENGEPREPYTPRPPRAPKGTPRHAASPPGQTSDDAVKPAASAPKGQSRPSRPPRRNDRANPARPVPSEDNSDESMTAKPASEDLSSSVAPPVPEVSAPGQSPREPDSPPPSSEG